MSWAHSIEYAQHALSTCSWEVCHQWLEQALAECQQVAPERRVVTLNNLAILFRRVHDYQQAMACYEQALEMLEELPGVVWLRGRVLANLAALEHRRGELIPARARYQEALEVCSDPVVDELAVAHIAVNLALLHLQQDRSTQAETLLRRARSMFQHHPDQQFLEARYHLVQARLAIFQKRLTKAEMEALQAIRMAQKLPTFDPVLQSQARAALAQIYSRGALSEAEQLQVAGDNTQRREQADVLFEEALTLLEDHGLSQALEYLEALSLRLDHEIRIQNWQRAEATALQLLTRMETFEALDPDFRARAWERASKALGKLGKVEEAQVAHQQWQRLVVRK